MVSVDENGKSQQVPRLNLTSEAEEKLFQAGKMRSEMRKEVQERNLKLHVGIDLDD
jgi:acyl-CoA hydrolase